MDISQFYNNGSNNNDPMFNPVSPYNYKDDNQLNRRQNVGFDPNMHDQNVQRCIMERGDLFNADTYNNRNMRDRAISMNKDVNNFGEITGAQLDINEIMGMPLRIGYTETKPKFENNELPEEDYNPLLDFDLYDKKSNINVSYFDPSYTNNNGGNNYSDLNNEKDNNTHIGLNTGLNTGSMFMSNESPELSFSKVINTFTWLFTNKFDSLIQKKSTFVMSPLNIMLPMIILYRGSNTSTEQELKYYLGLPDKNTTFQSTFKIISRMKQTSPITATNYIFVPRHYPINQAFAKYVNNLCGIGQLDLSNPRGEAAKINNIISNDTNGLIKDLINPSMINPNTAILLISTIYFKSTWRTQFNSYYTKSEQFYGSTNRMVPMMYQGGNKHNYYEDQLNQIIELDFIDGTTSMGFMISKNPSKPELTNQKFEYYTSQMRPIKIDTLKIPKFKHQSKFKVDNIFKKMGMREIFERANLSELITTNDLLYISDIIHQAIIIIDEKGAEASAATAVISYNCVSSEQERTVNFIANRPFVYYIKFKPTNTILFSGYYF